MKKLFYKTDLKKFYTHLVNTKNLEDISYMFAHSSIEKVSFKDFNISQVTNMSHLFDECSSLFSIDIRYR